MSKYLGMANFTPEGLKALRQGGAASRIALGEALAASLGGTQDCYYLAFGDVDAYAILDLPDDEAAASLSIAINEAGFARVTLVKLLTVDQVDEAFRRSPAYVPPGQ